jgi:hypothetical protein
MHVFRTEAANAATLILKSKTLELLANKWPLLSKIPKDMNGFQTEEWKTELDAYCMVASCIRHNPEGNGRHKVLSKTCRCGSILASIAKGMHDNGTNPHLTLPAIQPYLGKLDAFCNMILSKEGSLAMKELLCFHCRIFVMTNVKGANQSKYAIIGTDQCSSINFMSKGAQVGILPLCLDTQRFLFGLW